MMIVGSSLFGLLVLTFTLSFVALKRRGKEEVKEEGVLHKEFNLTYDGKNLGV